MNIAGLNEKTSNKIIKDAKIRLGKVDCTPKFRKYYKNAKKHNSDFATTIKDLIDNVILLIDKGTGKIKIDTFRYGGENKMIKISDNYKNGFENFYEEGEKSPLNLMHDRAGHDDDAETSEFGEGMKLAAMLFGIKFTGYSRINDNEYVKFVFDFLEMVSNNTFDVERFVMDRDEYMSVHPEGWEYGTTLVFEGLESHGRDENNNDDDYSELADELIKTYAEIIHSHNIELILNEQIINKTAIKNANVLLKSDIENNPDIKRREHLTIYCDNSLNNYLIMRQRGNTKTYYKYDSSKGKLGEHIIEKRDFGYELKSWGDNYITATYIRVSVAYLPNLIAKIGDTELRGITFVIRNRRKMGEIRTATVNPHASQLYTVGYLSYDSKKLNKEVGIGKDKRVDDIKCSNLKKILTLFTKDKSTYFSHTDIGKM